MLFIAPQNPGHSTPADPSRPRRWTGPAALIAGAAVLVIFALSLLFIFTPDPSRPMLDQIDTLMVASDWRQAEALCRQWIAERAAASQPYSAASSWTRRADPAAELALRLGISLSMQDRFDQARSVLDQALLRQPKDARLALNRALIDYRAGNFDDALARLRQLARDADYTPNVNYHIGRIYEARGQYDNALQAYRDELNISSSAGAWQRYLILKKMRGATTSRPVAIPSIPSSQASPR